MSNRYLSLVTLGLVLGSACTRHSSSINKAVVPVVEEPHDVYIEVNNHNWLDVVVYAVHGGQTTRLLTVAAASWGSGTLPSHVLAQQGEMRLLAHAVGNPTKFMSERIFARSGMTINWTLETDLKRSSLAVW